jgi:SAM-dependent methyltransferase
MHPRIYEEYERICSQRPISGSVLEVGAAPSDRTLLSMNALQNVTEKIGIDLSGPHEFKDFKVLQVNSNNMDCFSDGQFDAVLCNATFEHDKYFWKTLSEIKRVTKPGGLIVIGVPGFAQVGGEKIKKLLAKTPLIRRLQSRPKLSMFFVSTITFQIHNWPGDYYRFSPQMVREVILEGLEQTEITSLMLPPRLIGVGVKPLNSK